jgi:hypothetical protein
MTKFIAILIALFTSLALAKTGLPQTVSYRVAPYGFSEIADLERAKIDTIKISSIVGVKKNAIEKINHEINKKISELKNNIIRCRAFAKPHPWSFEFKFEKIETSEIYISVVFEKFMFCGGSPSIEKFAYIFSNKTGDFVSPANVAEDLFKKMHSPFPILYKDQLQLHEDTIEKMVEDSKRLLGTYNEKCDFYLNNITYKFWPSLNLIFLFPEFRQANSSCQKEYVLEIKNVD